MEEELAVCLRGSDSVDRYSADELTVIFLLPHMVELRTLICLDSTAQISCSGRQLPLSTDISIEA